MFDSEKEEEVYIKEVIVPQEESNAEVNARLSVMYTDAFIGLTKAVAFHAQFKGEPYAEAITTNAMRLLDVITERAVLDLGVGGSSSNSIDAAQQPFAKGSRKKH